MVKTSSLNNNPPGVVYWFTGLSSAGKTTIASAFFERLKQINSNVVFLDGDTLREIFGQDLGYSIEDRKKSAFRNARLCKMLSLQGFDVVCATISLFEESFQFNRKEIPNYTEIYLRVPMAVLTQRDPKGLYAAFKNGTITNVVGLDIPAEEPRNPTITLENDGKKSPTELVEILWNELNISPTKITAAA